MTDICAHIFKAVKKIVVTCGIFRAGQCIIDPHQLGGLSIIRLISPADGKNGATAIGRFYGLAKRIRKILGGISTAHKHIYPGNRAY